MCLTPAFHSSEKQTERIYLLNWHTSPHDFLGAGMQFFFSQALLGFLTCSEPHSLQFPHSLMLVSGTMLVALPAVVAQAPW